MRIYIESTIPSYVVARPARDILQAARQQLTRDWWELQRARHELFTSQVVLDEIAGGEQAMAERRREVMADIPLLISTQEVEALAAQVLQSGLLPKTADGDAAHIALATAYGMDILLTWTAGTSPTPPSWGGCAGWPWRRATRSRKFIPPRNLTP